MALTKEDIKDAVMEAMQHHQCVVFPREEDRVMARDMIATGGKIKRAVMAGIAIFILGGLGFTGYVGAKVSDMQTQIAKVKR